MKHFTLKEILEHDQKYRLNLINSISGYKSANLVGTIHANGLPNLAIFSSVVHLGSNPPLLGMIMRPTTVPRQTLENIRRERYYTINAVTSEITKQAHLTSAKLGPDESEYEYSGLTPLKTDSFSIPFVKESPIHIGLSLEEEISIKSNDTLLIVGKIQELYVEERLLEDNGRLQLDHSQIATVSGLNKYYIPQFKEEHPYVRYESKEKGKQ